MAQELVGPSDAIEDADVTITHASLVPRNDGLFLDIGVHVYADLQDPRSARSTPTSVTGAAARVGRHEPRPVQRGHDRARGQGRPRAGRHNTTTDVLLWFAGNLEPTFRGIVADQAQDAVNNAVSAQAEVQWFRSFGYVVSARRVTTTTAGLEVLPSLCKVDF